ncbi:hypothetical protein PRUPE_1G164300 [Prunus persica]|uniref:Uncharacterized protein n=1 Tax=Prunus persica TaxID=3760 RepID=A0A251QZH9_PRUPE|nr:hypothetical protein PRUPE_1G164300 [Prunus persica]
MAIILNVTFNCHIQGHQYNCIEYYTFSYLLLSTFTLFFISPTTKLVLSSGLFFVPLIEKQTKNCTKVLKIRISHK